MELTDTLKEKGIHFTPSIEIRIDNLKNLPLIELETNNREGIYQQICDAIKPIVNYNWGNNILRISNIFGDEFSIHIYLGKYNGKPSGWEITIWDYKGNSTVGVWRKTYVSNDDKLTTDEIVSIKKRLEEYSYGVQHCSACQSTMPSDKNIKKTEHHEKEYGGMYFAGRYCKDCWDKKYKAIEAKETYE